MSDSDAPFWKTVPMEQMTPQQWESLCDGCGLCCLHKVEDDDGEIWPTRVACLLLDTQTCRCKSYPDRIDYVPECLTMTPKLAHSLEWLPQSCAYKRVANKQALPWWHYLVTGDRQTVHEVGISAKGRSISEQYVPEDYTFHIVDWINDVPNPNEDS